MAKKKKNSSTIVHKEPVEKKASVLESFIPKDQNAILSMAIFLIIGLLIGALISYGAFSMVPASENNNGTNTTIVDSASLSQKVEAYLNDNLVVDNSMIVKISNINKIDEGLFEMTFEMNQNGELIGDGLIYASENNIILPQAPVFNMNEPLEVPDITEVPQQVPVETQELTEEEIQEIVSFNECVAESGIEVYGANWCGYTKNLVENLGGFTLVEPFYVECTEETELCNEKQITGYPTVMLNGEKINPERTFQGFAQVSGCTVPNLAESVETQAYTGGC